jgi:LysM repeat protein
MTTTWKRKTLVAILFMALFATAILPTVGHPLVQRSASAATTTDPIAVGNWYEDQYDSIIVQYANQYGLNAFEVKGQIMLESGFNTWAQSSVINSACDWTHDEGLMQINPYCSGTGGQDLYNPTTNIAIGTQIMSALYHEFWDYDLALQAYNIGASAVQNGQRNWAYSDAVDSYAQQFQSEHDSLYGGGGGSGGTYTVQNGDTLYSIGSKFGVSWSSIASANGIYYPYTIYVGEQLTIPGVQTTYTVQPGNTLYSIGVMYGVSWQSIASANGIGYPYNIYVGESLVIP